LDVLTGHLARLVSVPLVARQPLARTARIRARLPPPAVDEQVEVEEGESPTFGVALA